MYEFMCGTVCTCVEMTSFTDFQHPQHPKPKSSNFQPDFPPQTN